MSEKIKDFPNSNILKSLVNLSVQMATNCPCGELIEDCSYPYCGLGGETIDNKICEDCPTLEDCKRYGCQWG